MPAHQSIIVLADDLSGAAELAGIAFTHGLLAEVQRQFEPDSNANVVAIDTDSRHLEPAAAAERITAITTKILATNPAWIYKKVDSVLRGNVRAEIEAIVRVTGQPRALLIPANPSRGRIILGGRYLVDGIPLDQTAFAHDPQHPRLSSDVLTLLGPGCTESLTIRIPDIESNPRLDQLAAQCDQITLTAGAADFFAALLSARCASAQSSAPNATVELRPPVLLVCGSPAAWTEREAACATAGVPIVTVDQGLPMSQSLKALLLACGDSGGPNCLPMLAEAAAKYVRRSSVRTFLAEGGAT